MNRSKIFKLKDIGYIDFNKIANYIVNGGIGVIPTDTIYGLSGSALNKLAVDRIYKVRSRSEDKPLIILISNIKQLNDFGVKLDKKLEDFLSNVWPNPVTVILPTSREDLKYLHRGTKTLAFRLPDNEFLIQLLEKTGPIVSPSANPEGQPHAINVEEAFEYFKNNVDFYLDDGDLKRSSSTIIKIDKNRKLSLVRAGDFTFPSDMITSDEYNKPRVQG